MTTTQRWKSSILCKVQSHVQHRALNDLVRGFHQRQHGAREHDAEHDQNDAADQTGQKRGEDAYITAINCLKETALRQMILAKKRYGKTDGYIAWHGYQSFKPEEVTPQLAHEIGPD